MKKKTKKKISEDRQGKVFQFFEKKLEFLNNFYFSHSAIQSAITQGSRSGSRRNIDADDPIEESDRT